LQHISKAAHEDVMSEGHLTLPFPKKKAEHLMTTVIFSSKRKEKKMKLTAEKVNQV